MSREYFTREKGNILSSGFYAFLRDNPWTWATVRRGRSLRVLLGGLPDRVGGIGACLCRAG